MKATSREANENFKPKRQTDYDHILSVMSKKKDMTYKEIGQTIYKKLFLSLDPKIKLKSFAWKYDPNKVSRRIPELLRQEKIEIKDVRKCSLAKSNCSAYILV